MKAMAKPPRLRRDSREDEDKRRTGSYKKWKEEIKIQEVIKPTGVGETDTCRATTSDRINYHNVSIEKRPKYIKKYALVN